MRGPDLPSEKFAYEHLIYALFEMDRAFRRGTILRRLNFKTTTTGVCFILFAVVMFMSSFTPKGRITDLDSSLLVAVVVGVINLGVSIRQARRFFGLATAHKEFEASDLAPSECLLMLSVRLRRAFDDFACSTSFMRELAGLQVGYAITRMQGLRSKELEARKRELPVIAYPLPDDLYPLWRGPLCTYSEQFKREHGITGADSAT